MRFADYYGDIRKSGYQGIGVQVIRISGWIYNGGETISKGAIGSRLITSRTVPLAFC